MARAIALLAHVDAGKTTLGEAILLAGGQIRQAGRVDMGTSSLDSDPVERARGITVYAAQADFRFGRHAYTLIDTPGHADFAAEACRVLPVLDAAILLLDGTSHPTAQFAALYRRLDRACLPALLAVTKADRSAFDAPAAARMAQARLNMPVILVSSQKAEALNSDMIEELAEADDELMARYLDDTLTPGEVWAAMKRVFQGRRALLAVAVSGLTGQGVAEMLQLLDRVMDERPTAESELEAPVYQVRVDPRGRRVCFARLLSGRLRVRDEIWLDEDKGKISEIRSYTGARYQVVDAAGPGNLVGLVGLPARVGDVLVMEEGKRRIRRCNGRGAFAAPLRCLLRPLDKAGLPALMQALQRMGLEEPLMDAAPQGQEGAQVSIAGPVQLEIICQVLKERFGVAVQPDEPRILYGETVKRTVEGCGHYEPLRHYAEVRLALSPAPAGSGIAFESLVPVDELAVNWQNLIRTHVLEQAHPGPLIGAPLTDVKVVLLAGRAHPKHTEGGDFRQATCRAIRQALFGADMVLLEPWARFEIVLPLRLAGRAIADLKRLSASVQEQEALSGGSALLRGSGPLKTLKDYPLALSQYTGGEGAMALESAPPQPCHDAQTVVEQAGYDRGADTAHPAWSVFCAKGAGYAVPWDEVPAMMHTRLCAQRLAQAGL